MGMKNRNWYLQRILLNFSGDNSTYLAVKEIVVDNLSSMGVEASMEDGMTTLAGKILDIEPTIVVDDFDIDLTLSANDTSVYVGDTVVLSAHLTASYDTEDVDLVGDLQNATVSFYENNTLLGTATTNSNGVATYNYTTVDDTDLIFSASFDGTENFDEATSNDVTVNVSGEVGTGLIIQSTEFQEYGKIQFNSGLYDYDVIPTEDGGKVIIENVPDKDYFLGEYGQFNARGELLWSKWIVPNEISVDSEHRVFNVTLREV